MAKTKITSVDDYIAAQPEEAQAPLKRVRGAIRQALPRAGEAISYKMPAYKLHGLPVLYFAGWRRHYSLYPASDALVAALERELAPYEIAQGTIRFPLAEPVPVALIRRIAEFRAAEVVSGVTAAPATTNAKAAVKTPAKPATRGKAKPQKSAARRPVAKKPAAKKTAAMRPAAKKSGPKKSAGKKPATKKRAKAAARKS